MKYAAATVVFLFSLVLLAEPGELVIDPPTPECIGYHWLYSGGAGKVSVRYRTEGETAWRAALAPIPTQHSDIGDFYAGSIFNLKPGTTYECEFTMGETVQVEEITTRTVPKMPTGGTNWHVYPKGFSGTKTSPNLPGLLAATSGPEAEQVKPGDHLVLHAGEYTIERPKPERAEATMTVNAAAAAQAKLDGKTWHLYPPPKRGFRRHKDDDIGSPYHAFAAFGPSRRRPEFKPGDTILVHAGVYKPNRYDYREPLGNCCFWHGAYTMRMKGEPGRPIKIQAAGDGEVIFDGADNYCLFDLIEADHLWFDGITFQNTDAALYASREELDACDGLIVTNCKAKNVVKPVWHQTLAENVQDPWAANYYVRLKGARGKPVVIRAADDGAVVIKGSGAFSDRGIYQADGGFRLFDLLCADHLWFDGLTIRTGEVGFLAGDRNRGGCDGLIVTNCTIENIRIGVYGLNANSDRYYIADNRIIGSQVGQASMGNYQCPYGILLYGKGHVVTHNWIEGFHDGLDAGWWYGYADFAKDRYCASVDFSHNHLFNCGDNFIESDGGTMNIRVFGNRMENCTASGISNQASRSGPYYWIRNIMFNGGKFGGAFKPNSPKNVIAYHNTFFNTDNSTSGSGMDMRNNLYVTVDEPNQGKKAPVLSLTPKTLTAHDHNGYYVPPKLAGQPFAVGKGKTRFATLAEFAKATGFSKNSITVPGFSMFVNVPAPSGDKGRSPYKGGEIYICRDYDYRLKPDALAIDTGCVLPTVNDGFNGKAPDLGAIEFGDPMPNYGPRKN